MNNGTKRGPYDDMLELPHHTSPTRPRMSRQSRAAQFAPFAALSGHAAAIAETGRFTQPRAEWEEDQRAELDHWLRQLRSLLPTHPAVTLTYFQPDPRKEGGAYLTCHGRVIGLDHVHGTLLLDENRAIPLAEIAQITLEQDRSPLNPPNWSDHPW